jgi:hypothetical protein
MATCVFELKPFDEWKPAYVMSGTVTKIRLVNDTAYLDVPVDRRFTVTDSTQISRMKVDTRFTLISETP